MYSMRYTLLLKLVRARYELAGDTPSLAYLECDSLIISCAWAFAFPLLTYAFQ